MPLVELDELLDGWCQVDDMLSSATLRVQGSLEDAIGL